MQPELFSFAVIAAVLAARLDFAAMYSAQPHRPMWEEES
jgi:hypothetical protein